MMRETTSVHLTQQDRIWLRKLIAEFSGLDEPALTDSALERAVAQRLAASRLNLLSDYWPILLRDLVGNGELGNLVQLLTNKETFFFREMHHFEVLRDMVLPELLAARMSPLGLWSAGCATGEEPYSMAITLLEYQARHGSLDAKIVATDIDATALETARRGCYGKRSVRLVPDTLRRRYFSFDGQAYCVIPEVGRLVSFRQHNLAGGNALSELSNLDVIFCRNVTIYLDERTRDRLNARLADSLREGGYLFVASAETIGHDRDRLELISAGNTFLFRKTLSSSRRSYSTVPVSPRDRVHRASVSAEEASVRDPVPGDLVVSAAARASTAHSPPVAVIPRAVTEFQQQNYDAALRILGPLLDDQTFWPEACGLHAAILLQQERLAEAEAACQQLLAHDPWHADAHFLMGLIFRQQGQVEAAIQSLKQAIYLHPPHRDAHFYLAEVYHALGLKDRAFREYKNTLNILTYRPEDLSTVHLSGLRDDIVRQACEANLTKLQGQQSQTPPGRNKA